MDTVQQPFDQKDRGVIRLCTLSYLIVRFNLPDKNGKVVDAQCGVIVHFLVGPLHCGFRVSVGKKA